MTERTPLGERPSHAAPAARAAASQDGKTPRAIDRLTPLDRLQAAISILQHAVLAEDSNMTGRGTWGTDWMPGPALEAAIALLLDLQDVLEREEPWQGGEG